MRRADRSCTFLTCPRCRPVSGSTRGSRRCPASRRCSTLGSFAMHIRDTRTRTGPSSSWTTVGSATTSTSDPGASGRRSSPCSLRRSFMTGDQPRTRGSTSGCSTSTRMCWDRTSSGGPRTNPTSETDRCFEPSTDSTRSSSGLRICSRQNRRWGSWPRRSGLIYGISRHEQPSLPDPVIAGPLRDLLDTHLSESLTLADAADTIGASPSGLVRAFTRTFGIPPHQYVIGRRIENARKRLLAGEPPALTAVGVGFHDQAHLTRHFRRHVGETPARFAASGRDRRVGWPKGS